MALSMLIHLDPKLQIYEQLYFAPHIESNWSFICSTLAWHLFFMLFLSIKTQYRPIR